jgi:sec-independent protein translocase protein TatA
MFGLGLPEILLILVIALLIFGAARLPEIGRALGRALSEFKKATQEFTDASGGEKKDKKDGE